MSTANQNLSARSFQLQFRELLIAVFGAQALFRDFFAGDIEALDGIQENETAFYVKTSDIPVVIGTYNTGANVGFGTGTGNSTRFGPRTEIKYTNTPVSYTWGWNFHEGLDRHTVNNSMDSAVADRLELQARAKTQQFNRQHGDFIATSAGHAETLATYANADVLALFNALSSYFTNIGALGTKVVKVNTSLYNAIVDHPLVTTDKNSGVNIDSNTIVIFKDFLIEKIPDDMFTVAAGTAAGTYSAYAYITGIGKAFTGINTARTIESEDFDGVALQGAGKAGEFVLDDNKKAIVRVLAPTP